MVDLLHTFIGFVTTCFAVPSIYIRLKTIMTKKSEDMSIRFILIMIIGLLFWMMYGIGKDDII